MKFLVFSFVLLFCGLIWAEEDGNAPGTEVTQSCFPDMCNLLKDFGAMREKLEAMETRLKESENQVTELKNKETAKVVFTAASGGGNHPIGPFSTDTTVIYRTVKTNIGNAYNQATGIFAAPVSGIYYFTFFYHAGGSQIVSLYLRKNNEQVVQAYDHKSTQDTADNGGNAVLLHLQQGDQVYVSLDANTHVWGNDLVTTFSGFLLRQD